MSAATTGARARHGLVRRALAGHAALGLLAAGLLYVIALTGTLAVLHDRWQGWEQPDVPEYAVLPPPAVEAAARAALLLDHATPAVADVTVQLPTDDLPRATVSTSGGSWYVDPRGRIVRPVAAPWANFVVALHETLLLPAAWGYPVVGAFGVALAALAATGVLAHPRILRDAFRLRWRQGPHIGRVDWHNRLGVWTLPFTLALASTGAVLGLGTVAFSLLATVYYDGHVEQAYAPVFGRAPSVDAVPTPSLGIAPALAALHASAPSARPTSLTVQAPGTSSQAIQIIATHPRRLIYGESYWFDAQGHPLGKAGLSDGAIGQQAAASVYGLHFGNVGGLAMELAYLLFGTALCVTTATGPSIWLHKRRRRGLASARLAACWVVVVWGTPLLLVLALWLRAVGGASVSLPLFFWGAMIAGLIAATIAPARFDTARARAMVFGATAATGLGHLLLVQPGSVSARVIDLVACLGSATVLWVIATSSADAPLRR